MTGHDRTLAGLALFRGLEPEWLGELSAALERIHVRGGQTLMKQGDPGDAMYVLVHGRLRAYLQREDGAEEPLNDVLAGEVVGELALLATDVRTRTVRAIRDSTLLRLPASEFRRFVLDHPAALLEVTRRAILRAYGLVPRTSAATRKTFAVIPAGERSIAGEFADSLVKALDLIGPTLLVNHETVCAAVGADIAEAPTGSPRDSDLIGWLHRAEQFHSFLVFESGAQPNAWMERCLRQADEVLLVGASDAGPDLGPAEESALRLRTDLFPSDAALILVHEREPRLPPDSAPWLSRRSVRRHFHVRRRSPGDHARVARVLSGNGVGLVLGGGAARGFAHVGVLRALRELQVPVDAVTGASFGAVVGAGVAMDWAEDAILDRLVLATVTQGSLLDFTAPATALTAGRRLTRRIQQAFGDASIEDLWRPYSCVSSDLSTGAPHVHERGPVWQALRASTALPGIFPPVRSAKDTLLVDGSLMNNLPIDVMHDYLRGGRIIAVDLKAGARFAAWDLPTDGIVPGWAAWWTRWSLFRKPRRLPSIVHVLAAATMSGSTLSQATGIRLADVVLNPPVESIGLLRFDRYRESVEAGYRHAMELLPAWHEKLRGRA